MKATFKTTPRKPESENDAQFALTQFTPGWNTDRVFWSSRETGFASYVLGECRPGPTTFPGAYWLTSEGKPVHLVSVNGCGDERWVVWSNHVRPESCDAQAVAYFELTPP